MNLFISTSTKRLVIAITDDNIKYLYNEEVNTDQSSKVMPIIDEAFKSTNLTPKDIDTIYVTNGPGSFTGIRVGLTIAKVMAWSLKIKVVPISTLELIASTNVSKKYVMPLIDARRGYVFGALYDNELNSIIPDKHVLLSELTNNNYDYEVVSDDKFEMDTITSNFDILKVINKHKNDNGVNPHGLNPNYLKLTEAEEKFNESR